MEALLAHELAHIARRDWLWNGVQCVIEALLFFHPAVWWLGRVIRREREHACDDLAVAALGGDGLALAEALAGLERTRGMPQLALAAGGGALLQRISRLLSGPASPGRRGRAMGVGAGLAALSLGAVVALAALGMGGVRAPDLQVQASTAGALGPGDWRQITANSRIDGRRRLRVYRVEIDARGRVSERYQEAGKPRAVDARVRRWAADVVRLGKEPAGL